MTTFDRSARKELQLHPCGFPDCQQQVPAEKLACIEHWFTLPPRVREALWREYLTAGLVREPSESHRRRAVLALVESHWAYQTGKDNGVEVSRAALERAKYHRRRALGAAERDPFEGMLRSDVFYDEEALS